MPVASAAKSTIRAACYCRISSDPNDKRNGVTRQREDTAILCEVQGWHVAGYYTDNDRSASTGGPRPEWDRLLADVKAQKVDAIVVWNQDRGWRKMSDLESLRPLLEPRGVLLATTNIGVVDFRNADDVFRTQVSTALSEMEIAKMRVRQRRAARQKAEQGRPQWKRAFGYLDDTYQPDPVTAPLVADAYRAILAGASMNDVCKTWNAAGALTLKGNPWTAPQMSNFLRKARNAGLRSHTDTATGVTEIVGKGTWTPLVDEKLWQSVQHVLNAPGRAPGRKSVRQHLLTGVLLCGNDGCTGSMTAQWVMQRTGGQSGRPKAGETKQHNGQRSHKIVYTCKQCRGCSIRAEHVEPMIYAWVTGRLIREDAVDLLKAPGSDPVETQRLIDEKAVLHGRLNEIADERGDGLLTGAQAKRATERVQAKLDAITKLEQDAERMRVFDDIPLGTPEAADAIKNLSADRFRAVLNVLMEVTVLPVGKGGKEFKPERVRVVWR